MSVTFSKFEKLTKSREFGKLSKLGKKITGRYFIILYLKNDFEYSRLGVTVSKKASKLAVHRNRIKRLIREYFRLHKPDEHFDIVVIARHNLMQTENQALFSELEKLWSKLIA